jgi:hypothetical protein
VNLTDFKAKYKVDKLYAYRQDADSESAKIFFGWENTAVLNLSEKIVLSTVSKSKKLTEEEIEWSKKEGVTATSLEDYDRFFRASLDVSPADFLEKWDCRLGELELERKTSNPLYRDGEGKFLLALARFISTEKRFSLFGRVYKVISISDSEGNSDVSGHKKKKDKKRKVQRKAKES